MRVCSERIIITIINFHTSLHLARDLLGNGELLFVAATYLRLGAWPLCVSVCVNVCVQRASVADAKDRASAVCIIPACPDRKA